MRGDAIHAAREDTLDTCAEMMRSNKGPFSYPEPTRPTCKRKALAASVTEFRDFLRHFSRIILIFCSLLFVIHLRSDTDR